MPKANAARILELIDQAETLLNRADVAEAIGMLAKVRAIVAGDQPAGLGRGLSLGDLRRKIECARSVVSVCTGAILEANSDGSCEIETTLREYANNPLAELVEQIDETLDNLVAPKRSHSQSNELPAAKPTEIIARGPSSVYELIEAKRGELFRVMAILGLGRDSLNEDSAEDGNLNRALDECYERLNQIASDLYDIAVKADRIEAEAA